MCTQCVTCEISVLLKRLWAVDILCRLVWWVETRKCFSSDTSERHSNHTASSHKPKHRSTLAAAQNLSSSPLKTFSCVQIVNMLQWCTNYTQHQIDWGRPDKANARGRGWTTVLKILQKVLTHYVDTVVLQNKPLRSNLTEAGWCNSRVPSTVFNKNMECINKTKHVYMCVSV